MAILILKHNALTPYTDLQGAKAGIIEKMASAQQGEIWAAEYFTPSSEGVEEIKGVILAFKGKNAIVTFTDSSVMSDEIKTALSEYYTKEEIDELLNTKLADYYTKDEVDTAIDTIVKSAISVVGGDGIVISGEGTEKTISTNVELEIKTVDGKEMLQLVDGSDNTMVIAEVDASKFVVDGMLDSASIVTITDETELPEGVELPNGKYIKLTWNTDAGKSDTYVAVADLISEHKVVAGEDVAGEMVIVATNVVESTDENGIKVSTVNISVDDTAVKSALDDKISKEDVMLNVNEDVNQTIYLSLDNPNYTIIGNSWVCDVMEEGAMAWCNFSLSYDNGEQFYTFPNSISYSASLTHNKPEDGVPTNQIRIRYYSMETDENVDEYINVNSGSNIILTTYANGDGTVIILNSKNTKEFNTFESIDYINDEVSTLKTNISDLVETKIGKKDGMIYGQVDRTEYKDLTPQSPLINFSWENWTAYLQVENGVTQYEIIEGYEGGNVICVISGENGGFSLKKNGNKLEVRIGANVQSYDVNTYSAYLIKLTTTTDSLTIVSITYTEHAYLNTNESLSYLQNNKADKSEVETAISGINTTLESKADKTEVELKADKTEVELKADKTEVDDKIGKDDVMLYLDTPLEVTNSKTATFSGNTWEVTLIKTSGQINSGAYLYLYKKAGFSTSTIMQKSLQNYNNFVFDGTTIKAYAKNNSDDEWQLVESLTATAGTYYLQWSTNSATVTFDSFIKTPVNTSTSLNYLNNTKANASDLDTKIGIEDEIFNPEEEIISDYDISQLTNNVIYCFGKNLEMVLTFKTEELESTNTITLWGYSAEKYNYKVDETGPNGYDNIKYIYDNGVLTREHFMSDNSKTPIVTTIGSSYEYTWFQINAHHYSNSLIPTQPYVDISLKSYYNSNLLNTQDALEYLDNNNLHWSEDVLTSTESGVCKTEVFENITDSSLLINLPLDECYTKYIHDSYPTQKYLNIGGEQYYLGQWGQVIITCDNKTLSVRENAAHELFRLCVDTSKNYSIECSTQSGYRCYVETYVHPVDTSMNAVQSIIYLNNTKISTADIMLDLGLNENSEQFVFDINNKKYNVYGDFIIDEYETNAETNTPLWLYDGGMLITDWVNLQDVINSLKCENGILSFKHVKYGDFTYRIKNYLNIHLQIDDASEYHNITFKTKNYNKLNAKQSITHLNENKADKVEVETSISDVNVALDNKLGKFDTVLSVNDGETNTEYNVEGALEYLKSEIEAMNVIDCGLY